MDSMADGIRAGMGTPTPPETKMLAVRDLMRTKVFAFGPNDTLGHVIKTLLARSISGAPVVDEDNRLVGIVSAHDCLQMVASRSFHQEGVALEETVASFMSTEPAIVSPDTDVYAVVSLFVAQRLRRIPVVEDGHLVGLVTRSNVLEKMFPEANSE